MKHVLALMLLAISLPCTAMSCKEQGVTLEVLGSGGPEMHDGRNSSGYLIWFNQKARLLVEAGAGTSVAFGKSAAEFSDLKAVLLTHLHVDHAAELPAFIKGSYFVARDRPLRILGPDKNSLMPSTTEYVARLISEKGAYAYLSDFYSGDADYQIEANNVDLVKGKIQSFTVSDNIKVKATYVHHGPVAAVAWAIIAGDCTLVFSGDMSNRFDTLKMLAVDADLLVANNAIPEGATGISRNLHMPPSEIGKIASQAKVKRLLLSHFMTRTLSTQQQSIQEISKHYKKEISLAEDGMKIRL